MPAPLAVDLRRRVVEAYEAGEGTYAEVAARFGVGEASVSRWCRLKRETGSLEPSRAPRGFQSMVTDAVLGLIGAILEARNDLTQAELAEALSRKGGPTMSRSTVGRALKVGGWTRKKKRFERASWTRSVSSGSENAT